MPSLNSFENEYAPNSSFLLMLPLNALLLNSVKKKSDMRGPTPTSSIPNTPRLPGITQMDLGGGNCPRFACSSFAPAIQNVHPLLHALSVQFEHMHTCICHQIIWWCCVWISFTGHCYIKKKIFENCFHSHTWMYWKNNNALFKIFTSDSGFFRLIAYNIRTFILSCVGFLKRYFGSFVCFSFLFEKSMKRYLYPRLIFSKSNTGTVLQFCFFNEISNKSLAKWD